MSVHTTSVRTNILSRLSKLTRRRRRRQYASLAMESLEQRAMLSAVMGSFAEAEVLPICPETDPTFTVSNGTATLTGTHLGDTVNVATGWGQVFFAISNSEGTSVYSVSDSSIDAIVIDTFCGNDNVTIHGGVSEAVTVFTGQGNDIVSQWGTGPAYITGGAGDDILNGGDNNDLIFGGAGNDTIYGNGGHDALVGGSDDDTIHSGSGNDWSFGDGTNKLPDTLPTDPAHVRQYVLRFSNVNTGNDAIWGEDGADLILAGAGNDGVNAGAGPDVVLGQDGDDALYAGEGDDLVFGGAGNDSMAGANGDDFLSGGVGNDWMFGDGYLPDDARPMTAVAWALSDLSQMGRGNDRMLGGIGHDYMEGGAGDDVMVSGPSLDLNDPLDPVAVDPFVISTADILANVDAELVDVLVSEIDPTVVPIDPLLPDNDLVFGGSGNDRISTGIGHDGVAGGAGHDRIAAGAGNDIVLGDGPNSAATTPTPVYDGTVLSERDLLRIGQLNRGNDAISGGSGNDQIYAGYGRDVVSGNAGNDRLFGQAGNDVIYGGFGNDFIHGGSGDDQLFGGPGDDTIIGGAGSDILRGGAGNDNLNGGDGRDRIYGDAGDDELTGGDGQDYLEGGAGVDEFFAQDGFADTLCVELGESIHIDALLDTVGEC